MSYLRDCVARLLVCLLAVVSPALVGGDGDIAEVAPLADPSRFLTEQATAMESLWPAQRLEAVGLPPLVLSAAAVDALSAPAAGLEWAEKLWGKDTLGRRAFVAMSGLLAGRCDGFASLAEACLEISHGQQGQGGPGPTHPFALAEAGQALRQAAGTSPDREHWRQAAALLGFLDVVYGRSGRKPEGEKLLAAFSALPLSLRKQAAEAVVSLPRADKPGPSFHGNAQSRLWATLRHLAQQGKLNDPVLVELAARLMPDPSLRQGFGESLAAKSPSLAATVAEVSVAMAADDPDAVCRAATTLARSGKREEAIHLLRDAETRGADAAVRQRLRRQLFGFLRGQPGPATPPASPLPHFGVEPVGTEPPLARLPQLRRELELRSATSGVPPAEMALIRGDLYSVGGGAAAPKAAAEYAEAYRIATDPGLRRIAWSSWAGYDQKAAWAERETVDAWFAQAESAPTAADLGELACLVVAVGILADDEPGALAWGKRRVPALAATPGGARALTFLFGWQAVLLGDDLPQEEIDTWLASARGNDLYDLTGALAGGRAIRLPLTKGMEDTKLATMLKARTKRAENWDLAMSLAMGGVPGLEARGSASEVWQQLLTRAPLPGGPRRKPEAPLSAEELAQEEARQAKCRELTQLCLARLDGVERRLASNTGSGFVRAATNLLNSEQGKRFLPHAQALLAGTLAQAGELDLSGRTVARDLQSYAAGLAKCEATAAQQAEFREHVRQAFPDDRDIQQFLASLEAAPKP